MNNRPDISERYEILSSLGEGGMGSVYLAMDLELNRKVAIKVIKKEVVANTEVVTRTIREGKILSQLRHPGIASVYEMNIKGPVPYIVQEYISGQDLGSYIKNGTFLSNDLAWKLFVEQADVLTYIHEQGILHRDIKPENIIMNDKGQSILMDFGLALSSEYTRMTREGCFVGTLKYCPPEILRGTDGSGAHTDIYQLATVIHECMCHRNVIGEFKDASQLVKVLFARKWEGKPLNKRISPPLAAVIKKCCSFNSNLRPQNGMELKKLLLNVQRNGLKASCLSHESSEDDSAKSGKFIPRKSGKEVSPSSTNKMEAQRIGVLRKIAGAFFVLLLIIVSVYGGIHSTKSSGSSEIASSLRVDPFKNARYFIVLPKGFTMVVPFDKQDNLTWELKSEVFLKSSEDSLSGTFTRIAGGWHALLTDLDCKPGTSAFLSIREGSTNLGNKKVVFKEDVFIEPFKVKFSCNQISAQWKFNGFTNSTFTVEKHGNMPQGKPAQNSDHLQKWATTERTKKTILFTSNTDKNSCIVPIQELELEDRLAITLRVPFQVPKDSKGSPFGSQKTSSDRLNSSGSLVAVVKGTTNLIGRFPPYNDSAKQNRRLTRSSEITGVKKRETHISKTLINGDLLFLLTRGGTLTCLNLDNDSQSPYKLLWRKQLKGRITSIIPSGSGVGCTGTGNGRSVCTYDREGNETSREIDLFASGTIHSNKRVRITAMKSFEDSSVTIVSALMAGKNVVFLKKHESSEYKMIDRPERRDERVTTFYGLDTVFYSYQGEKQANVYVLNHFGGPLANFELIATIPNDPSRNTTPSMSFDGQKNIGMFCCGGILHQLIKSENSFHMTKVATGPVKAHAYKVESLEQGRFVAVAISDLADSATFKPDGLPQLNLIESTFNTTTGKFETQFRETNTTIFTEPHRCVVHGPVHGGNGRYCFTVATQLFVYEFGKEEAIHNELTVSTSAEMLNHKNTALIAFGKEGEVFSLNLN